MATAAAFIPPPPSGTLLQHQQPSWKSNAVSRSSEFLSAARTALKIAQQHRQRQQQEAELGGGGGYDRNNTTSRDASALPEWMANISPSELQLYQTPRRAHYDGHHDSDTLSLIQDSQTLLQLLDTHLSELHSLVRRRGHTNDPTLEIQSVIEKFQEGAKEVKEVCDSLRLAGTQPSNGQRSSSQRRKHYELLSAQLESQAKERTDRLKKELETRSRVLRDQSHRRKLLASGGGAAAGGVGAGNAANSNATGAARPRAAPPTRLPPQTKTAVSASSQFQSPLFTATSGGAAMKKTGSSGYSGYAGYGGSSASSSSAANGKYAGYGGTSSAPPSFSTGMRQRKQQQNQPKSHIQIDNGNEDNDYEDKYNKSQSEDSVHAQISLRRKQRDTRSRTQQARLAEKSIAELGVMFTKMSTLISQQGEVLERIEDDVEAAGGEIDAGHDELVKVYGMTKGNRGLILKVFGILIFLIVFMKLY